MFTIYKCTLPYDLNHDGFVDALDFALLVFEWLQSDCQYPQWCEGTDFNHDGYVNEIDFARFARFWHQGIPPCESTDPSPADGMSHVEPNAVLSWVPRDYTTLHEVYFGKDCNEVRDANTFSIVFVGSQDVNSWDPCGLESDTTYYWRVDENNRFATTKGDVWQFTTRRNIERGLVAHWMFD